MAAYTKVVHGIGKTGYSLITLPFRALVALWVLVLVAYMGVDSYAAERNKKLHSQQ